MKKLIVNVIIISTSLVSVAFGEVDLKELYQSASPSVIRLEVKNQFEQDYKRGTGFYIGDGCQVVTNFHLLKNGSIIKLSNGNESNTQKIENLKVDFERDLATFKAGLCGNPLPINRKLPSVGDKIITIGNPKGLDKALSNGVISGVRGEKLKVLQTTAPISKGSSGGPLINMAGEVIGVTTFTLEQSQNLNFAVPSNAILKLLINNSFLTREQSLSLAREDPFALSSLFFWSIHQGDIETAVTLVSPPDQVEFEKALNTNPPEVPSNAVIELQPGAPIRGNPHFEAAIRNTTLGIDLLKFRNEWWIVK